MDETFSGFHYYLAASFLGTSISHRLLTANHGRLIAYQQSIMSGFMAPFSSFQTGPHSPFSTSIGPSYFEDYITVISDRATFTVPFSAIQKVLPKFASWLLFDSTLDAQGIANDVSLDYHLPLGTCVTAIEGVFQALEVFTTTASFSLDLGERLRSRQCADMKNRQRNYAGLPRCRKYFKALGAFAHHTKSSRIASALVLFFCAHSDDIMQYERSRYLGEWVLTIARLEAKRLITEGELCKCMEHLSRRRECCEYIIQYIAVNQVFVSSRMLRMLDSIARNAYQLDGCGRGRSLQPCWRRGPRWRSEPRYLPTHDARLLMSPPGYDRASLALGPSLEGPSTSEMLAEVVDEQNRLHGRQVMLEQDVAGIQWQLNGGAMAV